MLKIATQTSRLPLLVTSVPQFRSDYSISNIENIGIFRVSKESLYQNYGIYSCGDLPHIAEFRYCDYSDVEDFQPEIIIKTIDLQYKDKNNFSIPISPFENIPASNLRIIMGRYLPYSQSYYTHYINYQSATFSSNLDKRVEKQSLINMKLCNEENFARNEQREIMLELVKNYILSR